MPRIRCLYADCTFIESGYCSAGSIEVDPDIGCVTYAPLGDAKPAAVWADDELEDWDIEDIDDKDTDLWLDEI